MRLLFDTHVLLPWALAKPTPAAARDLARHPDRITGDRQHGVGREIGIKQALGTTLHFIRGRVLHVMQFSGFEALPIGLDHALAGRRASRQGQVPAP